MNEAARLRGVWNILPTPFTDDGALDDAGIRSLVDFVAGTGVDGLTVLGVMGEVTRLSDDERTRVIGTAIRHAAGRVPICVGVRESPALATGAGVEPDAPAFSLDGVPDFEQPTAANVATSSMVVTCDVGLIGPLLWLADRLRGRAFGGYQGKPAATQSGREPLFLTGLSSTSWRIA